MSSSRNARRKRRQARRGKPSYPSRPKTRAPVIYDELTAFAPDSLTAQAGKTVPLTWGGTGGPRIGEALIVSSSGDGLRVSMRADLLAAPRRGMSFGFPNTARP